MFSNPRNCSASEIEARKVGKARYHIWTYLNHHAEKYSKINCFTLATTTY